MSMKLSAHKNGTMVEPLPGPNNGSDGELQYDSDDMPYIV
jgi:hypothetical protein